MTRCGRSAKFKYRQPLLVDPYFFDDVSRISYAAHSGAAFAGDSEIWYYDRPVDMNGGWSDGAVNFAEGRCPAFSYYDLFKHDFRTH